MIREPEELRIDALLGDVLELEAAAHAVEEIRIDRGNWANRRRRLG
jgi:hypothetical protein